MTVRFRFRVADDGREVEKSTAAIQVRLTMPVAVAAIATHLGVALRQDVQGPATCEFNARQRDRNQLGRTFAFRLLGAASHEGHFIGNMRDQPPIRNRAAGHVASQILQNPLRRSVFPGRSLDVHDPRLRPEIEKQRSERVTGWRRQVLVTKTQLALSAQPLHASKELLPKAFAEKFVVDQVWLPLSAMTWMPAFDPAFATERGAAAGNQGMDVRMSVQSLVPCMEHHQRCRLESELFFQYFAKCLPSRREQQIVQRPPVSKGQRRQFFRQREHHLEVIHFRQQQLASRLHPCRPPGTSALRTMPIAARVINGPAMTARLALQRSATQRGGAAERQFGQRALHLRHRLASVLSDEAGRVLAEDLRNGQLLGGRSLRRSLGGCHFGHWRTGSQSIGLGVESR